MNVGYTIKPSLANSSVALKVSMASGIKYFGSGWISNFSQLVSNLRQVEQQKTASLAFLLQMCWVIN
jgi:hypothetical protein